MTAIPATAATRKRTRQSNRTAILLSLVFGGLATVMAFLFLSSQKAEPPAVVAPPTLPVVVAAQDIPARTIISAEMVLVADIVADEVHVDAMTDLALVVGQIARYPIVAGEPVLAPRVTDEDNGLGLTTAIPAGKRAVSIEVTEVIGSAGLIKPGDQVDVVAAFEKDAAGVDKAVTVLQDVTILAVAKDLTPKDATAQLSEDDAVDTIDTLAARTVTLAVTPDQAEELFLSEIKGSLRLALRPIGDAGEVQIPGVTLDEIILGQ